MQNIPLNNFVLHIL